MTVKSNSKNRLSTIAVVVIIALLAINAFLLINKFGQDRELKQTTEQLEEVDKIKTELEKQYYEALSQLEELKGDNEELNVRIDSQKVELKNQKDQIAQLIRSGKANKAELEHARTRINELVALSERYYQEIAELKEANAELEQVATQLGEEKQILQKQVSEERETNQVLVSEKVGLEEELTDLEKANKRLNKKVTAASVIKVENIEVQGYKRKGPDKIRRRGAANNVDLLKICFDAIPNEVTNAGLETFYVRIINPIGETLSIQDLGSGLMTSETNGSQVKYTKAQDLEYDHEKISSCLNWEPNMAFQEGGYVIEVYNKGYLAGSKSFTLR